MARQSVRISQIVLTLGPGAILETRDGPGIILREGLNLPSSLSLEDLDLSSPEMRALLGAIFPQWQDVRIFQIPSSLLTEGEPWRIRRFPEWSLCVEHSILYSRQCPECRQRGGQAARIRARHEAIRFVLACPAGHLDDVDWDRLVHRQDPPHTSPAWYRWESRGSSLADIRIRCPRCDASVSLGWAYGQDWPCTGRFPEREGPGESPRRPGCQSPARIVQRQASNLRVPEVISLFTIPPPFTELHQLLIQKVDLTTLTLVLDDAGNLIRRQLERALDNLFRRGRMRLSEKDRILSCPDDEITRAIRDVIGYQPPTRLRELLDQELRAFLRGAREGIPPLHAPPPRSGILLEIRPSEVRNLQPFPFWIVPVQRLQVITAQIGYRRMVGDLTSGMAAAHLVDVSIRDGRDRRWFPGFKSAGEGLFIMLGDPDAGGWHPSPDGEASQRWRQVREAVMGNAASGEPYPAHLFRDEKRWLELHPAFVAWHTLSHLLIRALALDSGYTAPSIRERVYLEEGPDGRVRGGILLYAASRGGDGSLGGLLALARTFDRILERVAEMVRTCSADPLCGEHAFRSGQVVGAACHACCLISETSCEHRNFWLDRRVLQETGWL
jgi:hypothetical protein